FSSRRRHTRSKRDWSSDVCSSDLLWRHRLIAFANVATLTSGAMMIGLSSFLPPYVQGVMGHSAIIAGFTLTMMSVGWPLASTFAGHIFLKIGYRWTAMIGGGALLIG